MQEADWSFQKGLEYIFTARRCERHGRGTLLSVGAQSLAQDYRLRGMTLIMTEAAEGAESDALGPAEPSLGRRDSGPADGEW